MIEEKSIHLDNRRNLKRKKRRQKMRRRRMIFYTILLVLVFIVIHIFSAVIHSFKKNDNKEVYFNWFLDKAYRDSIGVVRTKMPTYNNFSDGLNAIYDEFEFMKKELMPGENHLVQANSYAYDTAEIRAYIRGEKKYTGKDKLVFLTFDDGPNTSITPQVLATLKKNNVHGTFFVVGSRITDKTYSILRKTVYNGNAIATHSFYHNYDILYPGRVADPDKIKEETQLTLARLNKVFGDNFHSVPWRYPGGHMSWQNTAAADQTVSAMNVEWIDWNCMTGDAEPKKTRPTTSAGIIETLDKSLNQNLHTDVAVVLMHDATNKQLSADSLQDVIDYFKEHNYKFGILK
ncbi:Peptidoglycan/xylan/chitin deacetylase, PgdA/CDA1 family [Peptoniphilus asaccharolyticus DSM 20463]|uniref:Peptidoglycan/xylan/chitin deacetylase, PgdA/CDA1 family n=1 Tax=Peptoniphilus asaccharolyticus DSM 20463 TaxID=573058 RepID=A0A1W1V8I7_PEPAS|nr:polysaccharide deacetylase family protein [Peptoniphilus asaccharolyticus]MBL7575904.1 polysaccharide deacetylase family protein [Peptoniphilus asaccharolyticus]SMB89556.1 Peptidoglycan/xylan/chitin deacetylase, PgdA/CDA1 family [Peptoniphilus asaccharolyticus DSM 20463]